MLGLMRVWIAIMALFVLCGCQSQPKAASEPFADEWRPGDVRFTPREREIVDATRKYLDKQNQKPVDGYYKVERTKDGYEVFVMFVAGYEKGRPLFRPGGHCIVLLREDGSVIRAVPGA
jgi:hypothetical protein